MSRSGSADYVDHGGCTLRGRSAISCSQQDHGTAATGLHAVQSCVAEAWREGSCLILFVSGDKLG